MGISILVPVANYITFSLLVLLNILIYRELRRMMDAKKRLIIAVQTTSTHSSMTNRRSIDISLSTLQQPSGVEGANRPSVILRARSKRGDSIAPAELMIISSPEDKTREFLSRVLIMVFWTSLVFVVDRVVKVSYRSVYILYSSTSPITHILNAISCICDMIVYSSFLFIYIRTNKLFRRKFFQIFFRRN